MANESKAPEQESGFDASTLDGIFGKKPSLGVEAVKEENEEELDEKKEEAAEPEKDEADDENEAGKDGEEVEEDSDEDEDEDDSVDELKAEVKRRKDAQKWGNEQQMKAAKAEAIAKKLVADGKMSEEEYSEMISSTEPDTPYKELVDQYKTESNVVNAFYKRSGEDAVEYAEAFDALSMQEPGLLDEIMALPAEDRIIGLIEKGKELLPDFKLLKEHGGSVRKTLEAVREEAYAQAKADLEAEGDNEDPAEDKKSKKRKTKSRPKIKGTGSKKTKASRDMSIKGILGK